MTSRTRGVTGCHRRSRRSTTLPLFTREPSPRRVVLKRVPHRHALTLVDSDAPPTIAHVASSFFRPYHWSAPPSFSRTGCHFANEHCYPSSGGSRRQPQEKSPLGIGSISISRRSRPPRRFTTTGSHASRNPNASRSRRLTTGQDLRRRPCEAIRPSRARRTRHARIELRDVTGCCRRIFPHGQASADLPPRRCPSSPPCRGATHPATRTRPPDSPPATPGAPTPVLRASSIIFVRARRPSIGGGRARYGGSRTARRQFGK